MDQRSFNAFIAKNNGKRVAVSWESPALLVWGTLFVRRYLGDNSLHAYVLTEGGRTIRVTSHVEFITLDKRYN